MTDLDYRELLRKYIQHVGACEGVDFLSDWNRHDTKTDVEFTDEEWTALTDLRVGARP